MLRILSTRLKQGHRTLPCCDKPKLSDRFRGAPLLAPQRCPAGCARCLDVCPTDAITLGGGTLAIDLGRCLFCTACTQVCEVGAIRFGDDHRLATRQRDQLIVRGDPIPLAAALDAKAQRLFGHSLRLREVSAGGCNACEADVNVLGTVVYDIGRFGIQFVASPRHADGILVTGPVPENMRLGLLKTWEAVPGPKIAVVVGACAISGGPFAGAPEVHNGVGDLVPIDLYIPGCPPHPTTILDGLLRVLDRMERRD